MTDYISLLDSFDDYGRPIKPASVTSSAPAPPTPGAAVPTQAPPANDYISSLSNFDDYGQPVKAAQAPAPAPQEQESWVGSTIRYGRDLVDTYMSGAAQTGKSVGWLLENFSPFEAVGKAMKERSTWSADAWANDTSEEFKRQASENLIEKDANGSYHINDHATLTTLVANAVGSLNETMLTAGAAKGAAMLGRVAIRAGMPAVIAEAAALPTGRAARILRYADYGIGAAAGGSSEGALAAGASGAQVEDSVNQMQHDQLAQSPRYRAIYDSAQGMDEAARREYARTTLAKEAGQSAAFNVGVATAMLGAPMGAFYGHLGEKIAGKAGIKAFLETTAGKTVEGVAGEGLEETVQSGAQTLLQNIGIREYADPKKDIWDGVLNDAIQGGVSGGLIGGGISFAGHVGVKQKRAKSEEGGDKPGAAPSPDVAARVSSLLGQLGESGADPVDVMRLQRWAGVGAAGEGGRGEHEYAAALEHLVSTGTLPEVVAKAVGDHFDENGYLTQAALVADTKHFDMPVAAVFSPAPEQIDSVHQALSENNGNGYVLNDGRIAVPVAEKGRNLLEMVASKISTATGVPAEIIDTATVLKETPSEALQPTTSEPAAGAAAVAAPGEAAVVAEAPSAVDKAAEIDAAYAQRDAAAAEKKQGEVDVMAAEKKQGEVDVMAAQAKAGADDAAVEAALARAAGTGEATPTAMEVAMAKAREASTARAAGVSEALDKAGVPQESATVNSRGEVKISSDATAEAAAAAVEAAANDAATSPQNDYREPSDKEISSGNYRKGKINFGGLRFLVENARGSKRTSRPDAKRKWSRTLTVPYGYFPGTRGADGDPVDGFLGPHAHDRSKPVFIIAQHLDGGFDENKVMLGFDTQEQAKTAYLENYPKGWKGLGSITQISHDEFRAWLKRGHADAPMNPMTRQPLFNLRATTTIKGDFPEGTAEKFGGKPVEGGIEVPRSRERDAKRSLGLKEPGKQNADTVTAMAREIASTWRGRPKIMIHDNLQALKENAPQFRAAIERAQGDGKAEVNAFYDPKSKVVHVVADRITSRADLESKLVEEALGHHGLRAVFGDDTAAFNRLLDQVWESVEATDTGKKIEELYRDAYQGDTRGYAEEYLTQRPADEAPGAWSMFTAFVRAWARRHGLVSRWTDNDIANLMERVHETVKLGRADVGLGKMVDRGESSESTRAHREVVPEAEAGGVRHALRVRGGDGGVEEGGGSGYEAVAGTPRRVRVGGIVEVFGPVPRLIDVARSYAESAGLPYARPDVYAEVDEARARRIAEAYAEMKHEPGNPRVRESYAAMIRETMAQWQAIKATGLKVSFLKEGQSYPYLNPRQAIIDVRDNNHLWVFPTDFGFGSNEEFNPDTNPLLAMTGEVIDGKERMANDIFRIVHDVFGHVKEGFGFRADGEENAWRAHSLMYSEAARPAMTSETRGQNSWVNYGPHGEFNRTASGDATIYADQKTGLLPDWVMTDGAPRFSLKKKGTSADRAAKIIRRIRRHITDAEAAKLREGTAKKVMSILKKLPSAEDFGAAALAGKAKRGWYLQSARALVTAFGFDAPRFAALLAATSPQVPVERNLEIALHAWSAWVEAGRPSDVDSVRDVVRKGIGRVQVPLDAWVNNATAALSADDPSKAEFQLSGPKVNSFFRNLTGVVDEVTNDTWMAIFADVPQTLFKGSDARGGKGPGYIAFSARVRQAAELLSHITGSDWTPAEVQETVWSWAMTAYNAADSAKESRTVEELVSDNAITDEMISSTPSFGELFHEQPYQGILAGFGASIGELAREDDGGSGETVFSSAEQAAHAFGEDALLRNARRIDAVRRKRADDERRELARAVPAQARGGRSSGVRFRLTQGWSERPRQRDAVVVEGVHYSRAAGLSALDGKKYGTNHRGAEFRRLDDGARRLAPLRNRVYFYPSDSRLAKRPESVVGRAESYTVQLNNIYDEREDSRNLWAKAKAKADRNWSDVANEFELEVIKAGFDGYRSDDMVVVLGTKPVPTNAVRFNLTHSKPFQEWFGESKVVDDNGEPKVVYHGSPTAGFTVFDPEGAGNNVGRDIVGMYFGDHPATAETYSGTRQSAKLWVDQDEPFNPDDHGERGNYAVYLRMEKPLVVDFGGDSWDDVIMVPGIGVAHGMDEIASRAKQRGYDGVIANNVQDEGEWGQGYNWGNTTYVVFDSNQVKSADSNTGAFSRASNDIRFNLDKALADLVRETDSDYDQTESSSGKPRSRAVETWAKSNFGDDVAPNGRRTWENFSDWFSRSKAVDDSGKPKLFLHGTNSDIGAFDYSRLGTTTGADTARAGFWFSDSPDVADNYANYGARVAPINAILAKAATADGEDYDRLIEEANDLQDKLQGASAGQNIIPAYLSLQNPVVIDARGGYFGSVRDQLQAAISNRGDHDGVIIKNLHESGYSGGDDTVTYALVYDPAAIKSATGNTGDFSRRQEIVFNLKKADPFYSAMVRAVSEAKGAPKTGDAKAWKGWLDGAQRRGEIKQAERDWMDIDRWLEDAGTVTRQQLLDHVMAHQVRVEDKILGEPSQELEKLREELKVVRAAYGKAVDEYGRVRYIFPRDENAIAEAHSAMVDAESKYAEVKYRLELLATREDDQTRYSEYVSEGGDNYRELLFMYQPNADVPDVLARMRKRRAGMSDQAEIDASNNQQKWIRDRAEQFVNNPSYRHRHWQSEKNVLAHARFDSRVDHEGKRVLFLQEVQSDWHQDGRRYGYKQAIDPKTLYVSGGGEEAGYWEISAPGIGFVTNVSEYQLREDKRNAEEALAQARRRVASEPKMTILMGSIDNAPLKNTDDWAMMVFKRMVRWAADNGFDRVAWTTGDQQNERYKLSAHIDYVEVRPSRVGRGDARRTLKTVEVGTTRDQTLDFAVDEKGIIEHQGEWINGGESLVGKHISEVVGRDLAEKIMGMEKGSISGVDLDVGGEGMRAFYDKILPQAVNKWAKKFGASVGTTIVPANPDWKSIPGVVLDPAVVNLGLDREAMEIVRSIDVTDSMRAAARGGFPLFNLKPLAVADIRQHAAKVAGSAPVEVVGSLSEVDPVLRPYLAASGTEPASFWADGKTWIVASNTVDLEGVERALVREPVMALGFRRAMGSAGDRILRAAEKRTGKVGLPALAGDSEGLREVADAVNEGMRRQGGGLRYTEADARELVAAAAQMEADGAVSSSKTSVPPVLVYEHGDEMVSVLEGKAGRTLVYHGAGAARTLVFEHGLKASVVRAYVNQPLLRVERASGLAVADIRALAAVAAEEGNQGLLFAPGTEVAMPQGMDIEHTEAGVVVRFPEGYSERAQRRLAPAFSLRNRRMGSAQVEAILERTHAQSDAHLSWFQKLRAEVKNIVASVRDGTISNEFVAGYVNSTIGVENLERAANSGDLLDAMESPTKMVALTRNLGAVVASVFRHGVVEFRDGAFQHVSGRKGLSEIFRPLYDTADGQNTIYLWEGYAKARRSAQLIQQQNQDGTSKEKQLTQDEIDTLLDLEKQYPEFRQVFDDWQAFNRELLDLAVERGAMDADMADLWRQNDYVPFYRVLEEDDGPAGGMRRHAGLSNQQVKSKRLYGSDLRTQPIMENILRNTAAILDTVYKHEAMTRIVRLGVQAQAMEQVPLAHEAIKLSNEQIADQLAKAGLFVGQHHTNMAGAINRGLWYSNLTASAAAGRALTLRMVEAMTPQQLQQWQTFFRRVKPVGKNIITVMDKGQATYYEVNDPLLLRAINDMQSMDWSWLAPFEWAKGMLTKMITLDPGFMVANWMRDTVSAWATSGEKFHPLKGALDDVRDAYTGEGVMDQINAAGGGGSQFYDPLVDFHGAMDRDINKSGGFVMRGLRAAVHGYHKIGRVSEQMNRVKIAKAVLERGGSVAEAAYQAMDLMNFSQRGDALPMQFLMRTVPFLNARVQGLYRLYKGARGMDTAGTATIAGISRAFMIKGMAVAVASLALAFKNLRDDRYEKVPDEQKDNYFHFFIGGQHFALPKPFEVGLLAATVPERLMRRLMGADRNKELFESLGRGAVSTLAFNPTPQLVKPLVEDWANKDTYSGKAIVDQSLDRLVPEEQANAYTSPTVRAAARMMPGMAPEILRSPVRLEHAVRAYFGTLGGYLLQVGDSMMAHTGIYPTQPSSRLTGLPLIDAPAQRFYRGDPERESRNKYQDDLYEALDEVDAIAATVSDMQRRQDFKGAQNFLAGHMDELRYRELLHGFGEQMQSLNAAQRSIMVNPMMSAAEKRERLDQLVKTKNKLLASAAPFLSRIE